LDQGVRSTMKSRWILVLCVTLLWAAHPILAAPQDAPAPADETEAVADADTTAGETEKKKFKNGLYVEVGYGTNDMDPLDTSTLTSSTQSSSNSFALDGMDYGRAAIGWQLPSSKGRFRLVWEGYTENGYNFSAIGAEAVLGVSQGSPPVVDDLRWWQVNVVDGALTAERTPPSWTVADDSNMDGAVQQDEVFYTGADISFSIGIEPNLQNRVQTVDVLYGREWGPRRVEGRWWGGLRYFAYEGTLLQGAWLRAPGRTGLGFTEGLGIRLLHTTQEATAVGPTGSLGLQVNFFDKRIQLFMNGQIAFLLSQIETDTGDFFTITRGNSNDDVITGIARLVADRSRTSWHTHIDAGARFNTKKGLIIEVAMFQTGFLDSVITPTELRIPQSAQELPQGTSAVFATQDLNLDGFRGSVAFQF